MKRKVLLIVLALIMVLTACGKGNANVAVEPEGDLLEVENMEFEDFLEEYVAKLETNEERENFLYLWESLVGFCERTEYKLKKAEFTGKFEFDPIDAENIPAEVKAVIDFSEFNMFAYIDNHENYKMSVNDEKVTLSFDGHEFYPTDHGYLTVQGYVEKYNEE